MRYVSLILTIVLLSGSPGSVTAADLPSSITSAPCTAAPTIDGVLAEGEWEAAPVLEFDLAMLRLKPAGASKRACQLRVMNSANAVYIARIPDEKVNNTLAPLDYDVAVLAFCRGKELARGDDRKAIAPGLYADKHVTDPGKDADDPHQDGRGAVVHDKGVYTFEWAIPLDSGDKNDIQVKPGDTLRFNLAYLDSFSADLKETQAGALYGKNLDNAAEWGTLKLAANVKDDGGSAFRGPAWISDLFATFKDGPASRLKFVESSLLLNPKTPAAKTLVSYSYRDPTGKDSPAVAKLYLPPILQRDPKARVPLYYSAGYELDDSGALRFLERGFAVMTPREVNPNPLIRTTNPDVTLLHIARALPFVDDARVVIGGGSAGGYMTLMLAAETFPLAGAAPDVPPVNWGYNAAYFFKQKDLILPKPGAGASKVPVLASVAGLLEPAVKVYGPEFGDRTWFQHSPLGQAATITCPVSVVWTTADVLVPIDQVGERWVQPFDSKTFPAGFTMNPDNLTGTPEGRRRLTDVLRDKDYDVTVVSIPAGNPSPKPIELTVSPHKQWSITILDEGPPEPQVGHFKRPVPVDRAEFFKRITTTPIAAQQLTPAKLERLMDRYAGIEWLPTKLKHLDDPASERFDVLRGLKTYVAAGPENARTFVELYAKLPEEKRLLGAEVMKDILAR